MSCPVFKLSCQVHKVLHPLALPPSSRTASRPASVHTSEREDNVDSSSIATTDVDTKISITLDSKVSTSCQAVTAVVEMYTLCNNRRTYNSDAFNAVSFFIFIHWSYHNLSVIIDFTLLRTAANMIHHTLLARGMLILLRMSAAPYVISPVFIITITIQFRWHTYIHTFGCCH